jgi:lipopolysaccharide/colanic/teichoic acid biosynthesis glycosyltransferase
MSLVGPRPAIPYEVREYQLWHKQRLDVIPGITGLWQVSGKNKLSFKQMIRLDLQYIQQQSLWLDILIMLKTPQVLFVQAFEQVSFKLKRWRQERKTK